jgi:hypothetical protein
VKPNWVGANSFTLDVLKLQFIAALKQTRNLCFMNELVFEVTQEEDGGLN